MGKNLSKTGEKEQHSSLFDRPTRAQMQFLDVFFCQYMKDNSSVGGRVGG